MNEPNTHECTRCGIIHDCPGDKETRVIKSAHLIEQVKKMRRTLMFNGKRGNLEPRNRDLGWNEACDDFLSLLEQEGV